jgi:hypothetical protein
MNPAEGDENYQYCQVDKSRQGVYASAVCEECGMCYRLPKCNSKKGWDGGYGPCSTYLPGFIHDGAENFEYCHQDRDRNNIYAYEVCEECGECSDENASTLKKEEEEGPAKRSMSMAERVPPPTADPNLELRGPPVNRS